KQLDFFAAYVIPEDVWYLIPAPVLLRGRRQKKAFTLLPVKPRHPDRYKCGVSGGLGAAAGGKERGAIGSRHALLREDARIEVRGMSTLCNVRKGLGHPGLCWAQGWARRLDCGTSSTQITAPYA